LRARALLLALSFAGFIALGLPDAVIGVAWPSMRAHFDLPLDALGLLFVTSTAGYVLASSATGAIMARIGVGDLLVASCGVTALALFGYTVAPSWPVLVACGVLTGFGAGAIDAAINTHAAVHYSTRLVNVLHAFYGVGAAAGPALMTALLSLGRPWQDGYRVIIAAEIALGAAFFLTRKRWPPPLASHSEHHGARYAETLRLGRMQLSLVVFLLYTGCEAAAGAWAFSLLYESRGVEMTAAGTAVALYWGGLFASRLGYAFLPTSVRAATVVLVCIVAALAGMALFAAHIHPALDTAALTLVGFASGPIFPSLIAATPARLGARHTANAVGLQISIAAIGLASLPAICGLMAQSFGLEAAPRLLAACWAVLLIAYIGLERLSASGAVSPVAPLSSQR
jgi:fucose permease